MATPGLERKRRQEEQRLVAQKMKRILVHIRSQMDVELRPQGVTTAQLQVLKAVREEPGASGAQLARSCYMTPQSAQTLLKDLERDGWIVREKEKGQGRVLLTRLTEEGEALLVASERAIRGIEKKVWLGVSDGAVGEMNRMLDMCLRNLESE